MNIYSQTLRVIRIFPGTTVDGPGLRTSIYFAGCEHRCRYCHNPESWDMNAGEDMSIASIIEEIVANKFNVTFSGGDPLYQNIENLTLLAKEIHRLNKTIWLYTGFTIEEIKDNEKYKDLLKEIDVIVDGPFMIDKRNIDILFRGSTNQRILKKNKEGLWELYEEYNK